MTTYVLKIAGTSRNYNSIKIDMLDDRRNPHTWEAVLPNPAEVVAKGDAIDIERDGTSIFQGILEWTDPDLGTPATLKVGGRHTSVKVWRKWSERYADVGGFWTNYYPNKIVEFLLHPSRSDQPELDNKYIRVGWGIKPTNWVMSASDTADADHHVNNIADRLNTIGWQLGKNQVADEYVQVDLGASTTICGIRIENKTRHPQEFVRNYKIETSTTGAWGGEEIQVASKTNNRAINIVESWTAAATRYVRITCTAGFADDWRIGDLFIYESSGEITGISVGTLTEHLPLNCSLMASDADSGQKDVIVNESWRFKENDDVIIGDDNDEEINKINSVDYDTDTITMDTNLANNYTTANNGFVTNLDRFTEVNLEYNRRTENINKIVKMCMTSDVEWQWEVTDAGVVNMGLRVGGDKSAFTFVFGTNLLNASNKDDDRERIDEVLVLGRGKGQDQDMNSSGWIGSGEYEKVVVDTSLQTPEACKARAEAILVKFNAGVAEQGVVVKDTHASGSWGLDDDITLTDATVTGLAGTYRVKRITRSYSGAGEVVTIQCTFSTDSTGARQRLENLLFESDQEGEYPTQVFDSIINELGFDLFYEAELMTLDSDVTVVDDETVSNKKYITMASAKAGTIWWGPGVALKPGEYEIVLMCKVADNSDSNTIVTIDVYSLTKGATFTSVTLAPDDFAASNTWQPVKFTVVIDGAYTDVEFRANTFQTGYTDFSCDWIGIAYFSFIDYPPGPPDVPTNVTATGRPAAVRLDWDPNTEEDFDHYEIYKHTSNAPASATKIAEAYINLFTYLADVAEYEVTLYFWVKAVDWTEHKSDFSTVTSAAPLLVTTVDLEIELRPWTSDLGFVWDEDNSDWDEIWWGQGGNEKTVDAAVTFADGTTTGINRGTYGALADGTYWVWWDESQKTGDKYDLQFSTTYSDAVGAGKGLVAVVQINEAEAESPTMIVFNSYTPTIGAGIIGAYAIWSKHITADWITGKKLRTSGRAAGPATQGVEMSDAGIVGYSGPTQKTFELEAATGYVSIYGVGMFIIKKADGTIIGYLDGTEVTGVDTIHLRAGTDKILLLDANGYTITIRGDTGDIDIGATAVLDVAAAELVIPAVTSDPPSLRQGHLWLRTDL